MNQEEFVRFLNRALEVGWLEDVGSVHYRISEKFYNPPFFSTNLLRSIADLELETRTRNALRMVEMRYLGDIASLPPRKLMRIPNIGRKGISDLYQGLERFGLTLDMNIQDWPWIKQQFENGVIFND